jgi:HSP20 family protein
MCCCNDDALGASGQKGDDEMTLLKRGRDPLAGVGSLQEAVRDMLATWPFGEREALSIADWTPSCNVSETVEEYRIEAELPGVKQEDVEVNVEDRVLTLRGERREKKEEKGKKYHRMESSYGSFMRSFTLPADADEDKVAADYNDGLLSVRIPRTTPKESKARAVEISS